MLFAVISVTDLEKAVAWYELFFSRPPDVTIEGVEHLWRLSDQGYVVLLVEPEHAGHSMLTLLVDDADKEADALRDRGLDVGPIELIRDVERKAPLFDPDGNAVSVISLTKP
jgi:predicted enzyme related to lactoylglutathione lyase